MLNEIKKYQQMFGFQLKGYIQTKPAHSLGRLVTGAKKSEIQTCKTLG